MITQPRGKKADYLHRQMRDPVVTPLQPVAIPEVPDEAPKAKAKRKRRPVMVPSDLPPALPKPKDGPPE